MSTKHPHYRIMDDEDLERESDFRQHRREAIQVKKFIGSGEDGNFLDQLKDFNDHAGHQESHG